MSCTKKDLFDAMESGKEVKITCTDGQVFTGRCWAYPEEDTEEPCVEVGSVAIYMSEIQSIEYIE